LNENGKREYSIENKMEKEENGREGEYEGV